MKFFAMQGLIRPTHRVLARGPTCAALPSPLIINNHVCFREHAHESRQISSPVPGVVACQAPAKRCENDCPDSLSKRRQWGFNAHPLVIRDTGFLDGQGCSL